MTDVDSFLRPKYTALTPASSGAHDEERFRAAARVEDKAITEIVKFQEDVGLQSVTDGEFRCTYFHTDFLEQLGGVKTDILVSSDQARRQRGAFANRR